MSMYKNHETDPQLERKGVWIDYGGFRVKVAKAGGANRQYLQAVELETKPVRRAMAAGTLSEERAVPIMTKVFAETIIMGWQVFDAEAKKGEGDWVDGIEQPDGSIGDYTVENVKAALKALPAIFKMIKEDAMADDVYLKSVRDDEAGN